MAVCPKCQTPLKEDFGLETCKGCGVVVFVNDDKVSLQEDEDMLVSETATEASAELEDELGFEQISDVVPEIKTEPTQDSDLNSNFESDAENSFVEGTSIDEISVEGTSSETESDDPLLFGELSEEPEDMTPPAMDHLKQPTHDSLETDLESLFESDFNNSETENTDQAEVAASILQTDAEAMSEDQLDDEALVPTSADDFLEEMQLFGEMDSEKFQDAIYFFDIEIASIDSKDIRDEILDILEDPKLNLKIEKPNQKIKNGVLVLAAVPAVKAFILIQRISHLPCELSWALVEVHDLGKEAEPELDSGVISENETDFAMDTTDDI